MSDKSIYLNKDITVPNILNIFIALSSTSGLAYLLWLASHAEHWYVLLFCFVTFGFVGNTVFGLLHETVHSAFNTNRKVNYFFGNILLPFFQRDLLSKEDAT